jgi:hypothetical protein
MEEIIKRLDKLEKDLFELQKTFYKSYNDFMIERIKVEELAKQLKEDWKHSKGIK